jgi:hypothetical protein
MIKKQIELVSFQLNNFPGSPGANLAIPLATTQENLYF